MSCKLDLQDLTRQSKQEQRSRDLSASKVERKEKKKKERKKEEKEEEPWEVNHLCIYIILGGQLGVLEAPNTSKYHEHISWSSIGLWA